MTIFAKAQEDALSTIRSLNHLQEPLENAARLIGECLIAGGKLLVCGNGGSAADGADFAAEFTCRFVTDRQPFPAMNLAACGSLLTAIGNDYGYEETFARQVTAFGKRGDVLVGITTSGNSGNVLAALRAGREAGLHSVALLGRDGGKARGEADVELTVESQVTARIQEAHKFLLHTLCEIIEAGWLLKPKS